MEGARMDSLQTLRAQWKQRRDQQQDNQQESNEQPGDDQEANQQGEESSTPPPQPQPKSEFHELTELFSPRELGLVQDHGGDLFQPVVDPRLSIRSHRMRSRADTAWENQELENIRSQELKSAFFRGSLTGVYENVSAVPTALFLAVRHLTTSSIF